MKKIFYALLCFSFTATTVSAQDNATGKKLPAVPHVPKLEVQDGAGRVRSISPTTAFLLLDIKKQNEHSPLALSDDALVEKYALIRKDGKVYANAFIVVADGFAVEKLKSFGVLPGSKFGNTHTALIPVAQLEAVAQASGIQYLQIGEKAELTMDNARTATRVNQVHTGTSLPQAYFGEGVVVGVIDIGFDYTHPNFYNSTGMSGYRVKRVWEQNATTGMPPTGYSYGRELKTEASILAAQRDVTIQSHGTHVAGIAAGAGGGGATTYTGVAPKSDLVLVASNFSDAGILEGIEYIQEYAQSVGKPCVINMSLGKHIGPHDGTSVFDKICDSFFVGEGRILVGSAGNEGNYPLHISKTYTSTDTVLYTFVQFPAATQQTNGQTVIDIWGEAGKNFFAGVYIYNINTDAFEDATPYLYNGAFSGTYSHTLYDADLFSPDPCYVEIETGIDPNNNKPRAVIAINNQAQDDNYRYALIAIKAANTKINMWASDGHSMPGPAFFVNNSYPAPVVAGITASTMGELGGTGKSIISVGAYSSKNNWAPFLGGFKNAPFYTSLGAIAPFSSKGPTVDNRTKPDITAPGNVIISSVNSFDPNYPETNSDVVAGVTDGVKNWWYASMQGTSMAAPMVTGIMALWLEAYPSLTPQQAKTIMKSTALTDTYTGTIPAAGNNTWGWGKINAWNGIQSINASIPATPNVTAAATAICVGSSTTLSAPSGFASYEWSNGATTPSITVNTAGTYKVRVKNSAGFKSKWSSGTTVTVAPNPAIPTITVSADTLISSSSLGNQWYRDGIVIPGATNVKYAVTVSGAYKVTVTNTQGCKSESTPVNMIPTAAAMFNSGDKDLAVYPNPVTDLLTVRFDQTDKDVTITVYDKLGKRVLVQQLDYVSGGKEEILNLSSLPAGNYTIQIQGALTNFNKKIAVVR